MKITNIKLTKLKDQRLLAYVVITLDNDFVVHDIRLFKTDKGYLVAMPSKRAKQPCPSCQRHCDFDSRFCKFCGAQFTCTPNITFLDVCHPINKEFRQYVDTTIIEHYQKEISVEGD